MEIANPIMAAEVRALRFTSVGIAAPTCCLPTDSFNNASKESAAHEGTFLTFCVNLRFKNDLLVCDERLTVPELMIVYQSMRQLTSKRDPDHRH
jgi:hypothetical protein